MLSVTSAPSEPNLDTAISLMAVSTVTGKSKRTLWRRLADGSLPRAPDDVHGRTMVPLAAVQAETIWPLPDGDWLLLLGADSGDTESQLELGYIFMAAGQTNAAVYWLEHAARQQRSDAMLWLARLALEDDAERQNEEKAWVWLTKAAAHGHPIARAQLYQLKLQRG